MRVHEHGIEVDLGDRLGVVGRELTRAAPSDRRGRRRRLRVRRDGRRAGPRLSGGPASPARRSARQRHGRQGDILQHLDCHAT